jgi:hypothetical protein
MCGAGESAARGVVVYLAGQPWGRSFGFEGGNQPLSFSPDCATVYYGKTNGDVEKVDCAETEPEQSSRTAGPVWRKGETWGQEQN